MHVAFWLENMPNVPFFSYAFRVGCVFTSTLKIYATDHSPCAVSKGNNIERDCFMELLHFKTFMTLKTFWFLVKGFRIKGTKPSNRNGNKTKANSQALYSLQSKYMEFCLPG